MTSMPRSGSQFALRFGGYTADVASIGASLRTLRHEGRDLVVPFDADEVRPGFRGAILAPWPNRVVDGRYTFDGREFELALTEPQRGHALHGPAIRTGDDLGDFGSIQRRTASLRVDLVRLGQLFGLRYALACCAGGQVEQLVVALALGDGVGQAEAVILFIIVAVISVIQVNLGKRREVDA